MNNLKGKLTKPILSTIAFQRIKYLGINKGGERLGHGKLQNTDEKIKEDINKWQYISCFKLGDLLLLRHLYYVK